MTSHVEDQIAARLARVAAENERKLLEREELAAARKAGLARRHAAKLRRQAEHANEAARALLLPDTNDSPKGDAE
ncbi:hypothetical protein ACFYZJ_37680 [Streptomyces sp. NPDC001848]|uniref:hypothetical protein n=1 Tax=Streptomyces sp. NPDC001848 TaxID=3364618 RepID=UPI0036A2CFDD